mmetsp:Transcript_53267/g.88315  ORF Transcript_53267/g.88315 Transcript_53267/m.88315 type:complete len:391 (+) Transcript_53267:352-1524(+)
MLKRAIEVKQREIATAIHHRKYRWVGRRPLHIVNVVVHLVELGDAFGGGDVPQLHCPVKGGGEIQARLHTVVRLGRFRRARMKANVGDRTMMRVAYETSDEDLLVVLLGQRSIGVQSEIRFIDASLVRAQPKLWLLLAKPLGIRQTRRRDLFRLIARQMGCVASTTAKSVRRRGLEQLEHKIIDRLRHHIVAPNAQFAIIRQRQYLCDLGRWHITHRRQKLKRKHWLRVARWLFRLRRVLGANALCFSSGAGGGKLCPNRRCLLVRVEVPAQHLSAHRRANHQVLARVGMKVHAVDHRLALEGASQHILLYASIKLKQMNEPVALNVHEAATTTAPAPIQCVIAIAIRIAAILVIIIGFRVRAILIAASFARLLRFAIIASAFVEGVVGQ